MKNKVTATVLLLFALLVSSLAKADPAVSYSSAAIPSSNLSNYVPPKATASPVPTPTPAGTATSSTVAPSSNAQTPSQAIQQSQAPSINPSANQGNQSQNNGSAMNAAMGAALMAAGMATQPPNMALLMMGALALAQAAADSGAADQSANTGVASTPGYNGLTQPGSTPMPTPAGTANAGAGGLAGTNNPTTQAGLAALTNAGYAVTPTGVTNPDGSTTPASAFSSPSSMAAAGLDPNAYGQAQKVIGATTGSGSGNVASGVGVSEGAAGAANATPTGDSAAQLQMPKFNNPFALGATAKNSLVAGKTIMFDGEPIGVRAQNIFDMVHAAYDKKRQRNSFIEGASPGGAVMRTPASNNPGIR